MKYVGHNGMMNLVDEQMMSLRPMPKAVVVEPSSCVIAHGNGVCLVKWLMLLLLKQLAPPSMCSRDVSTCLKYEGGAVTSQEVT
jgi:hypothetical protein